MAKPNLDLAINWCGRLRWRRVAEGIAAPFFLSCLLFASPASAQIGAVIGTIGGSIAIDHAGDELRDSIDHARAAAFALLGKADVIAKRRIDQIDNIIRNTVGGLIGKSEAAALAVLAQAKKDINKLEKEIFADIKKVIWEIECASRRVTIGDLGIVLGNLGDIFGTNQIRLTPAERYLETPNWYTGCFWWCKDPYIVDVMEPFGETYIQVRDLMEGAITAEHVNDETPANHLVGTYEYLSSFALKASCFYQGSEDRYNREYISFREKARKWKNVVNVRLQ